MSTIVQVLTVPTADTPGTTILVQTGRRHYVFGNQSEGTQRAVIQNGARLAKAQDFFMTGRLDWQNAGGLMGLTLTLADSATSSYEQAMETFRNRKQKKEPERPHMNIYGPPNPKHTLGTSRCFIFRKGLPIIATEYKDVLPSKNAEGEILPTWEDDVLKVFALPVTPMDHEVDARNEKQLVSACIKYDKSLNSFEEHQPKENETVEEREARYDRIRSAVMSFMFDSNWSFDALVEQHISQVQLPATMFIRNAHTNHLEKYTGPMPGGSEPVPDIMVLTRTPWPGAKVVALPPTSPAPESLSYIVRAHSIRGVFDPQRAVALGLKKGPLFARLNSGASVQNDKGETITPDMVHGPDRPGNGFAILDVPSTAYLEALVQREEFQSAAVMDNVHVFFWLLGPGVSGHPTLQDFIQKFEHVEHVVSSVDDCPNKIAFTSVAASTKRLALIDPLRYSVPHHDNTTLPQKSLYGSFSSGKSLALAKTVAAEVRQTYAIMPRFEKKVDKASPAVDFSEVENEMDPEILHLAQEAQRDIVNDQEALSKWRQLVARPDTEVITLGTGSALPSKYRNVSATLLRVPGVGNYLFDAGENTLGQLQRVFSPEEVAETIKNLRMIWISHLHADHHLGTASVIRAWYKLVHDSVPRAEPRTEDAVIKNPSEFGLSVVSQRAMHQWLREYSAVEDYGFSRILPLEISPNTIHHNTVSKLILSTPAVPVQPSHIAPTLYPTLLGLSDIQACNVNHCWGAMAVSLTFPPSASDSKTVKPLKVSYSGDCRPSKPFVHIGRHSTLLIHEATFDDELRGDAVAKKHSTTSEALGVGADMNATAVLLTHFSQRYQKIPVLETIRDGEAESEDASGDASSLSMQSLKREMEEDDAAQPMDDGNVDVFPAPAPPSLPKMQSSSSAERVVKVRSKDMKVAVAFDYMRLKIGDIAQMEKFNAVLNKLFEVEETVGEEGGDATVVINKNGKKTSSDEGAGGAGGGGGKKKKSKRNN